MISFSTSKMIPGLKSLWMECFGDRPDYTDYLFSQLLCPEQVLVYTDERGAPLAMLCIEPFELVTPCGRADAAYLFGVATRPDMQGRGLSTALLNECHDRLGADGFALSALVPASESLFAFYGKRGYETAFGIKKAAYTAGEIARVKERCVLSPAALEELADMRDEFFFGRSAFVRWDREYLAYVGGECKLLGGEVLRISCAGNEGYAVCYLHRDSVIVKEIVFPEHLLDEVLAALHTRFGAQNYLFYLPADAGKTTNKVLPFAMVRWYDREKQDKLGKAAGKAPWIAHVLD